MIRLSFECSKLYSHLFKLYIARNIHAYSKFNFFIFFKVTLNLSALEECKHQENDERPN